VNIREEETGENFEIRSFMICTNSDIIFGWANQGAWDGRANSTNGGKEKGEVLDMQTWRKRPLERTRRRGKKLSQRMYCINLCVSVCVCVCVCVYAQVAGYCERGDERFGSINLGKLWQAEEMWTCRQQLYCYHNAGHRSHNFGIYWHCATSQIGTNVPQLSLMICTKRCWQFCVLL